MSSHPSSLSDSLDHIIEQASAAQYQAINPKASIWVAASAGTGKTKVLTDRVLALLLQGTATNRLLCLTYTKAAATEMANRLQDILGNWVHLDTEKLAKILHPLLRLAPHQPVSSSDISLARSLFAKVLDTPGGLKIMTLHAFCQSVLKRFPLEAGIAPHFDVIEDRTARELLKDAQETVLTQARLNANAAEAENTLSQALHFLAIQIDETSFSAQLNQLLAHRMRLQQSLQKYGNLDALCQHIWQNLGLPYGQSSTELEHQFCQTTALPEPILEALAQAMLLGSATDQKMGHRFLNWLRAPVSQRPSLLSEYETIFCTTTGNLRKKFMTKQAEKHFSLPGGFDHFFAPVADLMQQVADHFAHFQEQRHACHMAQASDALLRVGFAILHRYQSLKAQRAQMDYDDLIQATQTLLAHPATAQWVLYKLDGGLDHILIDEAQDTNPEQWDIVQALSAEFFTGQTVDQHYRTLFVVGDIKQSIYSFQRADPDRFQQMQTLFATKAQQGQCPFSAVPMVTSFRSTATVLGFVDHLFSHPLHQDGVQHEDITHAVARAEAPGNVTLWPLTLPAEKQPQTHWRLPIPDMPATTGPDSTLPEPRTALKLLAQTIATEIRHWLDTGKILKSKNRPIVPGDIMILIQKRPGLAHTLISTLQQYDLPVAGADRLQLGEALAVQDLVAIGQFCLLPEDDLTLATLLKSPLVGISEEALFALANPWAQRGPERRHVSLWSALSRYRPQDLQTRKTNPSELHKKSDQDLHPEFMSEFVPELTQAVTKLTDILNLADRLPPYEFYAHILVQLGGRQALLQRLGAESAEPIDEFLSLSLMYERSHPPSLQGFLSWMANGETEIKREMDQSSLTQIRVMTIYGAKGLQAPIVIMPDTNRIPNARHQQYWPQTLKMPAHIRADWPAFLYAPQKKSALLTPLAEALQHKEMAEYRRLLYVALTRAEDDLILCGTETSTTKNSSSKAMSWHDMARTTLQHLVDTQQAQCLPLSECLDTPLAFPERWDAHAYHYSLATSAISQIYPKVSDRSPPSNSAKPLPTWANTPPRNDPTPAKPLMPSRPTEEETLTQSPLHPELNNPFQRGRLIHRLLELLPEYPESEWERAALEYLNLPVHDLPQATQQSYWQETYRILSHSEFAPLFGMNSQAEVALSGIVTQKGIQTVISGQVDRLVVTDQEVSVIDYKTNRPPPTHPKDIPEIYRQQLQAYRLLLQDIFPDRTIRTLLLWTDTCHLMEVPPL